MFKVWWDLYRSCYSKCTRVSAIETIWKTSSMCVNSDTALQENHHTHNIIWITIKKLQPYLPVCRHWRLMHWSYPSCSSSVINATNSVKASVTNRTSIHTDTITSSYCMWTSDTVLNQLQTERVLHIKKL